MVQCANAYSELSRDNADSLYGAEVRKSHVSSIPNNTSTDADMTSAAEKMYGMPVVATTQIPARNPMREIAKPRIAGFVVS